MESFKEILGWVVTNWIGGVILILIGLYSYWDTARNPQMKNSPFREDIGGRAAGIMFILLGLLGIIYDILY